MEHRLRKHNQFNYVYKKGERFHTEHFTLFVVKSKFQSYRIGFSVNKKIGKANKRNLLKRRLKEITRREIKISPFCNYVVLAKEGAESLDFDGLRKEVKRLFEKFESKKNF